MIHCYARSSQKIKQNFTAAKVTKNTQTQGLQICENRSIEVQPWTKKILITIKDYLYGKMQQAQKKKSRKNGILCSGLKKWLRSLHLSPESSSLSEAF